MDSVWAFLTGLIFGSSVTAVLFAASDDVLRRLAGRLKSGMARRR